MEKNKSLIIVAAVALILTVALIGSIAQQTQVQSTLTPVVNEVISIAGARLGNGTYNDINESYNFTIAKAAYTYSGDCPITNVVYGNASTNWTVDTDYVISLSTGIFSLKNTSATTSATDGVNTTYIDYDYCGTGYINSSWGRSILNLTPGLIAIAILVIAILAAWQLLGKTDED